MIQAISIGAFGIFGTLSRWALDTVVNRTFPAFPVGTLSINIIGSFIAGLAYVVGTERGLLSPTLGVGILVGFCGGFTTFSAYSLQACLFLERSEYVRGLSYLCLSPLLGLIGVALGLSLGRHYL